MGGKNQDSVFVFVWVPIALGALALALTACGSGGGGGGAPPAPATLDAGIASVTWPVDSRGDVPLAIAATGDGQPLDLLVETSYDGGQSWHPASLIDAAEAQDVSSNGDKRTVRWDSLADLGPRPITSGRVRITPVRDGAHGMPRIVTLPPINNRKTLIAQLDDYFIHYGAIDATTLRLAESYRLVIIHPFNGNVSVATAQDIMDGVDPTDPRDDCLVLGYKTIGEDSRTIGMTTAQMLADPRFVGDGTGPRVDPRGPDADGGPIEGLDPLGDPAPGGTGFASYYLNDNAVDNDPNDIGDGIPDRNSIFGGCYVNAGDPAWFDVVDNMLFDGADGFPGFKELLRTDVGRGYGLDGLFLDTTETCAPNYFTDGSSPNQSEFEWTAVGFRDFYARLRTAYPDAVILQNRAMFFFDSRKPQYAVNTRAYIDILLVESYRLDSHNQSLYSPYFFADNKHNFLPAIMAEAAREDGFRVLSLGYAEGPPSEMNVNTLIGASSVGFDELMTDIYEAETLMGMRHYLTDAGLILPNEFVRFYHDLTDNEAPRWSSTYNDNVHPWPIEPDAPTPRVGIQAIEPGPDCMLVRWDVALDMHKVEYTLYYSTSPLDFVGDPNLTQATALALTPYAPPSLGYGPAEFANQFEVTGLREGTTYYCCIRAKDELGNEEKNTVTLHATPLRHVTITIDGTMDDWALVTPLVEDPADVPDSSGPDWRSIWVVNDSDNLYVRFTSENAFNVDGSPGFVYSRMLIMFDTDNDPSTGFAPSPTVGSELLVAGNALHTQAAGNFSSGYIGPVTMNPLTSATDIEFAIPLNEIDAQSPGTNEVRILFLNDEVSDYAPGPSGVVYRIQR